MKDGQLELLVHRRLLGFDFEGRKKTYNSLPNDPNKFAMAGVGECLDETEAITHDLIPVRLGNKNP